MAIILLIETEDGAITDLPILDKMVLGRSSSSDYKVSDTKMSGSHCSFEVTNKGQLLFKDLGSTNGSFVNNSQVHQVFIQINDIVRVGNTTIKIDDKKLTLSEKSSIGVSKMEKPMEATLPELNKTQTNSDPSKKRGVVLGKNVKEKTPVKVWSANENEIEPEASSGLTKLLELNKKIKKK